MVCFVETIFLGWACLQATCFQAKGTDMQNKTERQDFTDEGGTEVEHVITEISLGQSVSYHVCVTHTHTHTHTHISVTEDTVTVRSAQRLTTPSRVPPYIPRDGRIHADRRV